MELRDIEIFLMLAEELHFGRTAQRLHVTQARVSQAIKAQERRIGALLFERTSRAVALTPIGERLRNDLRTGYDTIHEGLTKATAAARGPTGTLRLGVMGVLGHDLRDLVNLFEVRHPGCDVELREIHFSDPFGALRRGHLDGVLLWRPVREPDLTEGPVVLTEGRMLAVWTGHPLADRPAVSLEDFGDYLFVNPGSGESYWTEAMLPAHTPAGRPVHRGPLIPDTFHEILTHVSARRYLCPVNAHAQRYYAHPGVVFLPVNDAPVTEWAIVWRTAVETAPLRALAAVAREYGSRAICPADERGTAEQNRPQRS